MRWMNVMTVVADGKMNEINGKRSVFWHLLIHFVLHVCKPTSLFHRNGSAFFQKTENQKEKKKTKNRRAPNWKCVPLNKQFKAVNVNTINVTSNSRARWGNTFIFCWVQIDRRIEQSAILQALATAMFQHDMVERTKENSLKPFTTRATVCTFQMDVQNLLLFTVVR